MPNSYFFVLLWFYAIYHYGSACSNCEYPPPGFPSSIPLIQKDVANYAKEIFGFNLFVAIPRSPEDVVTITNWAVQNNYQVRPHGFGHAWSPITITNGTSCTTDRVIILRMRTHLIAMQIVKGKSKPPMVRVQTGASMESLLTYLEAHGFGIQNYPRAGDLSVGGVLAVDGHGCGFQPTTCGKTPGFGYGSFSNLIVSFHAVVWNAFKKKFVLRKFHRSDPMAKAFLTSLGRSIITEVTLQIGEDYNLRSVSTFDIPSHELFSSPTHPPCKTSFQSLLEIHDGRVDVTTWPWIDTSWTRLYSVRQTKPPSSRLASTPYNFQAVPRYSAKTDELESALFDSNYEKDYLIPEIDEVFVREGVIGGINDTDSWDIWGTSKNINLNQQGPLEQLNLQGLVIVTARLNVQNVMSTYWQLLNQLMNSYKARGIYPWMDPLVIRVTGVDDPADVVVHGAESPSLSSARTIPGRPELDTAIWVNIYNVPGNPHFYEFLTDVEGFCFTKIHDGVTAFVRPEWSTTFGYTKHGPFTNRKYMKAIPHLYPGGWNEAISILNKHDPTHTISNEFLDRLLVHAR